MDSIIFTATMSHIDSFAMVQGSCERILSTPLPHAYTLLVFRTTCLYILLAPFAMAPTFSYSTVLFNALVAYTFFGLDELARQLENPFSKSPFSLALGAMNRVCEIAAAEALGEKPLDAVSPNDVGLLM